MDSLSKPLPDAKSGGSGGEAETPAALHRAVRENLIRYGAEFHPEFIVRARGSYLYDENGRAILDFTSGQMCATLGHNHPAIVAAIEKSCREVLHLFSGMLSPAVASLARHMAALLPRSLFGRLALLLLVVVAIAIAATIFLFRQDRITLLARQVDAHLRHLQPARSPCVWSQVSAERRATYACTPGRAFQTANSARSAADSSLIAISTAVSTASDKDTQPKIDFCSSNIF